MAPGLPDKVDCARLAAEAAVLERDYALSELPRLQDLLADRQGFVHASFAFAKAAAGRVGATVSVEAAPHLVCQRCLKGFAFAVVGDSDIEFVATEAQAAVDSPREMYVMDQGLVSLRDLAEEELLLALPVVAACATPDSCGQAPALELAAALPELAEGRSRPFSGLKDLLKKT